MVAQTQRTADGRAYTFARHETFHLRDGWLYKGLEAVRRDEFALYDRDAHHQLGIGINMLKALSYWLQATNLVQPEPTGGRFRLPMRLTAIGELVHTHDPFLEDVGTLWLLHVELASNQVQATFWYWAFNEFSQREFTEDRLLQGLEKFLLERDFSVAPHSLKKDARCFIRTYLPAEGGGRKTVSGDVLDCPLSQLGLLREGISQGQYKFHVGDHRNLPLDLFSYTLYRFRERLHPNEVVLGLEDLRWAPLSPGRLLCLDNRALVERIEELEHRTGMVHLVRTAGLNMVTLEGGVSACDLLRNYYLRQGVQNG